MNAEVDDANQLDEQVTFVTAFARADQRYGGYSYQTELYLKRIIAKLGLQGEIFATPNSIEIALWKDDESRQTIRLAVTRDTEYDLNKIAQIHDIAEKVTDGQISLQQGLELLTKTDRALPIYGNRMNAFAFVLCGSGLAVMIGASWLDVLFGGLLGLISFGAVLLASRAARISIVAELLAAALAGFSATGIALLLPGLDPLAITVCAVVWFVPGFGLTTAPREIIYGNTLSGIIYLTEALLVAIKLFAGAIIGIAVAHELLGTPTQELFASVNSIWAWAFVPILTIGLGILFKVTPKNLALILIGSWLVWGGVQLGNKAGSWEGTFFGAMVLAVFTTLCATRLRVVSATVSLPLIMILVPGYGFLSALYTMRVEGISEGLTAVSGVVIIIVAIIAGIFVGEAIVSTDFSKLRRAPSLLPKLKLK